MWQGKPYLVKGAKEYKTVWFVIHYLDFDSIAPYYVCSQQLEIVNEICKRIIFMLLICQ